LNQFNQSRGVVAEGWTMKDLNFWIGESGDGIWLSELEMSGPVVVWSME
jgi:hypothetical protein